MVKFNNVLIPTPSVFSVSIMDITKADRNANGTMIIEKITTKRKIESSWSYLSNTDLSTLLTLVSTDIFITVDYPDPLTGAERSGVFYLGDRTCGAMDYINNIIRWKDIKFNLIEQ